MFLFNRIFCGAFNHKVHCLSYCPFERRTLRENELRVERYHQKLRCMCMCIDMLHAVFAGTLTTWSAMPFSCNDIIGKQLAFPPVNLFLFVMITKTGSTPLWDSYALQSSLPLMIVVHGSTKRKEMVGTDNVTV